MAYVDMSSVETKHILIALDESGEPKHGLEKAIYIAKLTGAKITCVNVTVVSSTLVAAVTDYQKYLTEQAQKMLDSAKESCEKQGIQFASEVLNGGSPASQIAEFAEKQNVDLVIVGSKGLGGIRGKILGSVPSSLVHESSVSVLVVK